MTTLPLLSIHGLKTHFFLDEGTVQAVNGVNLQIPQGQTLAIVGESGSGKSVTAFSILQLIAPPGRIVSGDITLHRGNEDDLVLTDLPTEGKEIRSIRGKDVAMIFQEPMTSLSPVHTVGNQIMEAIRLHLDVGKDDAKQQVADMMGRVGIPNPTERFHQYPHQMSGGLRQRAVIAMALACRPKLLIADEPTTALDVTIQAQILQLMRNLQAEFSMSILLITHDLGVVAEMADQVAVMYLGRVVEQASAFDLFHYPQHPYTRALLSSVPGRDKKPKTKLKVIEGTVPSPFEQIAGCPFHPRCEEFTHGQCDQGSPPELVEVGTNHQAACVKRQPVDTIAFTRQTSGETD